MTFFRDICLPSWWYGRGSQSWWPIHVSQISIFWFDFTLYEWARNLHIMFHESKPSCLFASDQSLKVCYDLANKQLSSRLLLAKMIDQKNIGCRWSSSVFASDGDQWQMPIWHENQWPVGCGQKRPTRTNDNRYFFGLSFRLLRNMNWAIVPTPLGWCGRLLFVWSPLPSRTSPRWGKQ